MKETELESYLTAYKLATDREPSRRLVDAIVAIPLRSTGRDQAGQVNMWGVFDLVWPRAVGWAFTCCLGLYIGLLSSAPDQGNGIFSDDYYIYGQAQIMLSETLESDEVVNEERQ